MNEPLAPLARALLERKVRFLLIGVSGANLYAPPPMSRFVTEDWDLFLPTDPHNLVLAWAAGEEVGAELWLGEEPLDRPRHLWLAERISERRALTRVTAPGGLKVDLTLVMKGFEFEEVLERSTRVRARWRRHSDRTVASHRGIQHAAGRDKDLLFLATHRDALEQLLKRSDT